MKIQLISLFPLVFIGFLPIQAFSQVVLPPESVVQHYKDQNRRIQSHRIEQATATGNGDTLFYSMQTIVDTFIRWNHIHEFKPVTGFPLGNYLTKLNSGNWISRTADSTLLLWDFSANLNQNWTVYQDSANTLIGQYLGVDTINHFSMSLPIWKYKLTSTGSKFDSLNNKEIWLSEFGIVRCPDFRAFPFERAELILAGYNSPVLNKGLRLSPQTFAPHLPGDSIIIQHRNLNPYYPSSDRYNYFYVYHLSYILSTSAFSQKWVTKTTKYELKKGYFTLVSTELTDVVDLSILATTDVSIIPWANNRVVYLYDSLPFSANPDSHFERTYAHVFGAYETMYVPKMTYNALQSSFEQFIFRGNWGFHSRIRMEKSANGSIYTASSSDCIYRTVGNRRWGAIPTIPSNDLPEYIPIPLVIYPNPATTMINFYDDAITGQEVSIQLFDNLGNLVKYERHTFPAQMEIGELKAGLYLTKIYGPDGYGKVSRFIKVNP